MLRCEAATILNTTTCSLENYAHPAVPPSEAQKLCLETVPCARADANLQPEPVSSGGVNMNIDMCSPTLKTKVFTAIYPEALRSMNDIKMESTLTVEIGALSSGVFVGA